jgi:hypothetical protein
MPTGDIGTPRCYEEVWEASKDLNIRDPIIEGRVTMPQLTAWGAPIPLGECIEAPGFTVHSRAHEETHELGVCLRDTPSCRRCLLLVGFDCMVKGSDS